MDEENNSANAALNETRGSANENSEDETPCQTDPSVQADLERFNTLHKQ